MERSRRESRWPIEPTRAARRRRPLAIWVGLLTPGLAITARATTTTLTANNGETVVSNTAINDVDLTKNDVLKLGAGTYVFGQNNGYTGTTTISAGTLQVGNGGSTGSLGNGGAVSVSGKLGFNRSTALTVGNTISGGGTITFTGAGPILFSANNDAFTGTTSISGGQLRANNAAGSATGTGALTIDNNGLLGGSGAANNSLITIKGTATIAAGASDVMIGSLSTNAEKWMGGGFDFVKIRDAASGTAGSGTGAGSSWDVITMSALDVTSLNASNKFTVRFNSFAGANGSLVPGAIAGFDPLVSRSFRIATIKNGLPATAASLNALFALDASDFIARNRVNASSNFSLAFGGDVVGSGGVGTISVVYNATPEPTTALLFGVTATTLLAMRQRLPMTHA